MEENAVYGWKYIFPLALIALLSLLFLFYKRRHADKHKLRLDGPKGLPLIGNALALTVGKKGKRMDQVLLDWSKTYGPVFAFNVLNQKWVVVSGYDAVHDLLVTKGHAFAGRRSFYRMSSVTFGCKDILASDASHEHWNSLRKAAHRCLHQTFEPDMSKTDEQLSTLTQDLVNHLRSHEGKVIDVRNHIYDFVCKAVATLMTGRKPASDDGILAEMKSLEKTTRVYLNASTGIVLDLFPWTRHLGNPAWSHMKEVCRLRDNLWEKMWTACKESYEADKTATCMMHTLAQLLDDKSPAYDSHLDAENIRGLFVDLVAASISSMSSHLYALLNIWLHSPDILRRLQDETDRVMGKERAPSLFDRDDMHYASATILELLRYCNITPTVYHKALEDAEICGHRLPHGTGVIGLVNSVHLDDEFWKDPHAFRPERFLHGDGTLLPPEHPNRKHLMPFGAGPRLCVGEMFALRRMFAFVTSLAQAFNVEPGDNLVPCGYGSFEDGLVLSPRSFTIKLIPRMSFTRDPLTSDDD